MSNKNKITLKSTDENDMTATVELDSHNKTSVNWGFNPEKVEYVGEISLKDLEESEEEKKEE